MSTRTEVFLCDGYTDRPAPGTRAALVAERNRIRMLTWQDPADKDLKEELERLEQLLRDFDRNKEKKRTRKLLGAEFTRQTHVEHHHVG